MKKIYFIKNFNYNKPSGLDYIFKYREIYYSEQDMIDDIKIQLIDFYEESITNEQISYEDFYNSCDLSIEVAVVSLNHRNMTTKKEYDKYLEEVKTIKPEDLLDYLISFTDDCTLIYDHNLNLKETYCWLENFSLQFAFSYKALFPEKYHVEKYKNGDRVRYNNEEYIIYDNRKKESIYDSTDPLNHLQGYSLFTDDGYFLQDDKWCYFSVDEDLEPLPSIIKETTSDQIDSLCNYIFKRFNNTKTIFNINNNFKYDKLIRSDNKLSVVISGNLDIEINNTIDGNLMSYMLFDQEDPVAYIIGYIQIPTGCIIDDISIIYNEKVIDKISIHDIFEKGQCINIARYIGNKE